MSTNSLIVKCELNIEDAIAWNYYFLENSTQWKKNWKLIRLVFMPIMAICFVISIVYLIRGINRSIISTIVGGGIGIIIGGGGFIYYVFYPDMLRRKIRKTAKIVYGRGENSLIGKHNLIISAVGITDNDNAIVKWTAVEDIVKTDTHIFILVHPNKAIIIPKRAFPDEAVVDQFIQDINTMFLTAPKTA
jgi:hypothetical protein